MMKRFFAFTTLFLIYIFPATVRANINPIELGYESVGFPKEETKKPELPNVVLKKDDVEKDYKYTRGQLYSLIEKGQEAINGIMEVAGESASPRAYEVAGQLIKSVADTTDKLVDLQKKVKELDEDSPKSPSSVTNNALFVGSTSDLSKMLKKGFLNNNESNEAK